MSAPGLAAHLSPAEPGRRYRAARAPIARSHLQAYLDEFVFRFNRRRTPAAAFGRLLGLSLTLEPATYQMLTGRS